MIRKILMVVAIGMLVFVLTDCGPTDHPAPQSESDQQLVKLSASWRFTEATLDAVAQPGYESFRLVITGTPGATEFGYTCSGRPSLSPWPSNGKWKFGSNALTDIIRDNDMAMNYTMSADGGLLELTFEYQGDGFAGRTDGVKGQWRFKFSKNAI